jgi:hypothetical protein
MAEADLTLCRVNDLLLAALLDDRERGREWREREKREKGKEREREGEKREIVGKEREGGERDKGDI